MPVLHASLPEPPINVLIVEPIENDFLKLRQMLRNVETQFYTVTWAMAQEEAQFLLRQDGAAIGPYGGVGGDVGTQTPAQANAVATEKEQTNAQSTNAPTQSFDVCLYAHRLNEPTGIAMLQRLQESAAHSCAFILVTDIEDHRVDVTATRVGAADYLVKSQITPLLLERSIRYALRHKQSEELLRRSQQELLQFQQGLVEAQRLTQATIDALGLSICVLDEKATIIAVNQAWRDDAQKNGLRDPNYGVGTNYLEVCEASEEAGARAAAQGIRAVLNGTQEEFFLTYPYHTPTFTSWLSMRVGRIDGTGPVRLVISHADVTDNKKAEYQLRRSEQNLAQAQEMAHIGSWEYELLTGAEGDTTRLYWSDEVFRIFGYEPGSIEVSYENFVRALHPADRQLAEGAIASSLHHNNSCTLNYRIIRPDGQMRFLLGQAESVLDENGRISKLVGIVRDITEEQRAGEEMEAVLTNARCVLWQAQVQAHEGWEQDEDNQGRTLEWRLKLYDENIARQVLPLSIPENEDYLTG